jgi:predicted secreted protein
MEKELCEASATYEYKLLISDALLNHKLDIEIFPDLNIIYKGYQNNLCISRYTDARCVWEGDLEVTLLINGKTVILNDHDKRKGIIYKVGNYEFQGDHALVIDRSRDKTYLVFTIHKCKNNTRNNNNRNDNRNNNGKNNTLNYNLYQPFIIEHSENVTTGYKLSMKHSPGVELISDTFSNHCKPGLTGCGGTRTYVFHGIRKGPQFVTLTYGRPWDPNTNSVQDYHINIV